MPAARACLLAIAALLASPGWAQPPGIDRDRASAIRVLTPAEHDLYSRAYDAGARGDWVGARALAARGGNAVASQLVEWRYVLDIDSGATFAEIDAVAKATRGWPLPGTLQARGERAMPLDMAASDTLAWFAGREPNSSLGKVRLGEALVATGATTRGARLIREGWEDGSFDAATELAIVQRDGTFITPANDRARLDALLWRDETSAARREMSRVDDRSKAVALARIALDGGLLRARGALAKVKNSEDPSLLFDWARALRVSHKDKDAHAMLLRINAAPLAKDHPGRWWTECAIQAHDALAAGDARLAARLVAHAGLVGGDAYAEQQFLGGFISLRFLKDDTQALAYFRRLEAGVARPISKARARYWMGRTYEAIGDNANAIAQYRIASNWPETFYGQLALARIDPAPMLHLNESMVDTPEAGELNGDTLMPQIKILADLGQENALRLFIDRDLETNTSPGHLRRLMLSLREWGYPEIALRLAKSASYASIWIPDLLFPLLPLPSYKGPGGGPEPALVLGLIRQETEFDPYAVSSAGARGLMQIMTGTGRMAAQAAGLSWRPGDLFDPNYNIQLGMVEITSQLSHYGGSLVVAAAAYNAGPGNARKWLDDNGDPRGTATDPIDWIEQIPFGETRNYVQRVVENTGVYRARLAGRDMPLKILGDVYAPGTAPAVLRAGN